MTHGRLLSNLERWKRRLPGCTDYVRCNHASEHVLHTVRGCKWACKVWEHLIPLELLCNFFSIDFGAWVLWMLKGGDRLEKNHDRQCLSTDYVQRQFWNSKRRRKKNEEGE